MEIDPNFDFNMTNKDFSLSIGHNVNTQPNVSKDQCNDTNLSVHTSLSRDSSISSQISPTTSIVDESKYIHNFISFIYLYIHLLIID